MKSLITFTIIVLTVLSVQAQKENIKTYSVSLDDFINFVAENYEHQEEEENDEDKNITFLIQVANEDLSTIDMVILKQGFKLLSERLNDHNSISILTYFGFNGVALDATVPSDLNKINSALNNLKSSIHQFHDDGIELAYKYAEDNIQEETSNSIVIIRNSNTSASGMASLSKKQIMKIERKKKKKQILKVAVSILPEIIAIIKN